MSDSEEEITEKHVKVVFLGESNVGKTSIIRRFCYDDFTRLYNQTIGADFYLKRFELPGKQDVTVRISDVGGLEICGNMFESYIFNADVVILVYDITNAASFDSLNLWLELIRKNIQKQLEVAIFGNKSDLEHKRAVRLDKTQKFVNETGLHNFLVSAKTGENVNPILIDIISSYLGISLTRIDRERQVPIITAEIIPRSPEKPKKIKKIKTAMSSNTSVCNIQFIEKYTENIRFCIICNYLSKIIPALQSRCTRFRFGPLSSDQILPRLNYVVDEEKVTITEDGKKALLTLANGDMRKVLNVLQSTWLAYKNVTEDNVYTCVGHPLRTDIETIVKWLLNEDFQSTYKNIKELKTIKGLALHDIITEVHTFIHRIEFPFDVLIELLNKLAEIEFRLSSGANENIQLTALISTFQLVKDITPPE